jgi:hypothetical protein
MVKKLRVVGSSPVVDVASMPPDLGRHGREMWQRICAEYDMSDCAGYLLLQQCCLAADRAENCRQAIEHDGAIIRTTSGQREHPLLKAEMAARSFILRGLTRLGIAYEPVRTQIGRPASYPGYMSGE